RGTLLPVAGRAEELQVLRRARPAEGDRDHVVELQELGPPAAGAATAVAGEDVAPDLLGDRRARRRWGVVELHELAGPLEPPSATSLALQRERHHLLGGVALVLPPDPPPERPPHAPASAKELDRPARLLVEEAGVGAGPVGLEALVA